MTRNQAVEQLLGEYKEQQARNRAELLRREEEARRDPAIATALDQRPALLREAVRAIASHAGSSAETAAGAGKRIAACNRAIAQALAAHGLPADYLDPVYRCPLCKDTGQCGEPLRRWCPCFQQRLTALLCSDEGMAGLQAENFDTFDENVFPDTPLPDGKTTQRAYMRRVREVCERYADDFPQNAQRNLLFCGRSGLGKSFLMNCVAQRVLSRGFAVVRITASKFVDTMRRYHYNSDRADLVEQWSEARLLLLDDLGVEPMIDNVTIEYLFNLLNDRLVSRRHTVMSTNFSPEEIVQAYTERLSSRLLDTRNTRMLLFQGQDVRMLRRMYPDTTGAAALRPARSPET
jgi:DNA replication protein DnaC